MNRQADDAPSAPIAGERDTPRRSKPRKFLYKTGDRPLEGYVIRRGVGQGGFGEVYFATSDAGKEVALKLLRRNLDVELRGVRQCLNLKHPNLVALFDIRTDATEDEWVVMEYVAGESLEQALERSPQGLPADEASAWVRGVAAGVAALHLNGVVHRDLKPGNLFLEGPSGARSTDPGALVKVGDYGLAKFISASRRSGHTESIGTVHYMAPEIAGGRYGREIDTYAMGVILYEMLTGRVPFDGESAGEVLMKHLTAEPDLAGVDPRFHEVIRRALAKDPDERIRSVEEFVTLLPSSEGESPAAPRAIPTPPPPNVWIPVSTPPHAPGLEAEREPLWQAVVALTETCRARWRAWDATPMAKGLSLLALVALVIFSGAFAVVPAIVLPVYVVYYFVWAMFLQKGATQGVTSGVSHLAETRPYVHKPTARRARRPDWRLAARERLRSTPARQSVRSLVGSMLMAALVAGFASGIAAPFFGGDEALALGLWMGVVTTLGAWGVLAVNHLTETRVEDHAPRRGLQLALGALLGIAAFAVAGRLGLALPYVHDAGPPPLECFLTEALELDVYNGVVVDGAQSRVEPTLAMSVLYFTLVYFALRWWKSAEYVRYRRIGLGSLLVVACAAWLATLVAWYPQPLGMTLAAVIALATQASSHWLPPSERAALARGAVTV